MKAISHATGSGPPNLGQGRKSGTIGPIDRCGESTDIGVDRIELLARGLSLYGEPVPFCLNDEPMPFCQHPNSDECMSKAAFSPLLRSRTREFAVLHGADRIVHQMERSDILNARTKHLRRIMSVISAQNADIMLAFNVRPRVAIFRLAAWKSIDAHHKFDYVFERRVTKIFDYLMRHSLFAVIRFERDAIM